MLSSFTWLTLLQPTLSIIIGLVFLVTAFLCLALIKPNRKVSPILQTIGFLLLAIPYALTFTNLLPPVLISTIVLVGALLILSGFIISRLRLSSAAPAPLTTVTKPKVATVLPATNKPIHTESATPSTPPITPPAGAPAKAQITPGPATRSAISAKSGLRSEPLVRLPGQKRKRARQFVNFLIGFFVFFLVGWGSYAIAKRVIQPPASPLDDFQLSSSPLPHAEDQNEAEVIPPEDMPPDEALPPEPAMAEETTVASPSPSPSATPATDTVTIKDTETGYLNVREGASTATKIITTIDPGTTYPLLDTSANGDWYKIQLDDGNAGWIATKYADKKAAE